jgi:1,4-alpha-glucan branching enzyme
MIKITKKGQKAWVTFSFVPQNGESVAICGEWNDWKDEPMKIKKSGEFYITKVLSVGTQHQFGYRINETLWHCDNGLECVASPFGSQNSLLML